MTPLQSSALDVSPTALDVAPRQAARDDAARLAHELNNLLAIVVGHADALDATLEDPAFDRSSIEAIRRAVASAAEVVHRVRALGRSRPDAPVAPEPPEVVEVDGIVRRVGADLGQRLCDRLTVALHTAPNLWSVVVDPALLERTLAALVGHAADVAPHGSTVSVRTMNVEMGASRPHLAGSIRRARYVRMEVSFSDGDPRERLEPQAATGDAGPTSVIGGCVAAIIAAGARVTVNSDGVTMTTVSVLLPTDGDGGRAPAEPVRLSRHVVTPEVKTIVLFDADGARRALLHKILRAQSFDVVPAATEADVLAAAGHRRVDLLVADRQPAAAMSDTAEGPPNTAVRVLYTGRQALVPGAFGAALVTALPTPFGAAQLVAAVRRLLDSTLPVAGSQVGSGPDWPIHLESCPWPVSHETGDRPEGSR